MNERYTHGHHESVLRSHRWRTAENSAAYLLPHLGAGQRMLDVGCGPGTISVDLAGRVAPGTVVGIDRAENVVEEAATEARRAGCGNVHFAVGTAYAIPAPTASFDVVHAHQVLQHLADPVQALVEMHRVLRPGGILAVRDSDAGAFAWAPADKRLARWLELYHDVTAHNGAEADAGRHLLAWAHRAGFADATATSSTWTFADQDSRAWLGNLWAERVQHSALAQQAVEHGLSTVDELQAIAAAWRAWARQPDAVFIIVHGEILARA